MFAVHGESGFDRVARFDSRLEHGEVVVTPELAARGEHPLAHPLDELLVLHRIVREGGMILRGSAVVRDGRALVFIGREAGPEGPGQTGQHPGAEALPLLGSRVVLRRRGDEVRVFGAPWQASSVLRLAGARLDAVHVIEEVPAVRASRLTPREACSELLARCFAPLHDPLFADQLCESAHGIAECIQVIRLGMPNEGRVVPFTWGRREAALAFSPPFLS